jgi:23S rRNA (adenine2503-C2)-methyltransferase
VTDLPPPNSSNGSSANGNAATPAQAAMAPHPLGMTYEAFVAACHEQGMRRPAATALYHAAFRRGELPPPHQPLSIAESHAEETPEGTTTKFLSTVTGAQKGPLATDPRSSELHVESVVIPMLGRSGVRTFTLCLSSQVGCAMGCGFCETAQMGLIRSLTPTEIVSQWFNARFTLGHPINNIVFMGMGEPMDNIDAVIEAITILTDHHGPAIPMSKITVSTVGRIDGLARIGEAMKRPGWHRLGLAISVNASNDTVRSQLMPINRSMPMAQLRQALLDLPLGPARKLCFEYVLIPGVNDQRVHAAELAEFLSPWASNDERPVPRGLVNVIPYNPRRNSPWPAPEEELVETFMAWLNDEGLFVKRRRTKGRTTMAACGQLGAAHIRQRRFVPLTSMSSPDPTPDPASNPGTAARP